jgi:hypothetical protein
VPAELVLDDGEDRRAMSEKSLWPVVRKMVPAAFMVLGA